ncbi:EVE domain-containing protein [Rickettsiales bacterium LUAb2]
MQDNKLPKVQFWLIKSEPSTWSWQMQVGSKTTKWDGVRNYEARNNLQKMKLGDLAFFYHSVHEKQIVGIVKVIKEYYPDDTDPKFGIVDVEAYKAVNTPLSLASIKADKTLQNMPLVTRSRLSVMAISEEEALIICQKTNTTLYNN